MAFEINLNKPLAPVGVIIGAIVTLLVLAGFVAPMFDAGRSVTENVTTADTGSTIGDTLAAALGPILPVVLVVGIIGLAFAAVSLKSSD